MDTFDPRYDVEMRELILPEHNKNKLIDGQMINFLDDDYKKNIILGVDFNT